MPSVIQSIEPYVSSEDIDKGSRWSKDIAGELEDSYYGILCVTRTNIKAPWLNFEAGALSKSVDSSRVSPFLFGLKRADVHGPLLQFQSTVFEKEDVKKLILGLNKADDKSGLADARIEKVFEVWWPQLQLDLNNLGNLPDLDENDDVTDPKTESSTNEILEEVLELTRQHNRILNNPEKILPVDLIAELIERKLPRDSSSKDSINWRHPVFRDLLRNYSNVVSICDNANKTSKLYLELQAALEQMDRPIQYIARHSRQNRLLRASSSKLLEDDLLDLEE